MSRIKIIDIFGDVAAELLKQRIVNRDRCVNGTRIALEVMRRFSVPAYPLVVSAIAVNQAFAETMTKLGRFPSCQEEGKEWYAANGAHSVGVGVLDKPTAEGQWPGHLVAIVRGTLVDVSSGQMSRPDRGMDVPDILSLDNVEVSFLSGKTNQGLVLDDGTNISYRAFPNRKDFTSLPGFVRDGNNMAVANEIIAEMKRRM